MKKSVFIAAIAMATLFGSQAFAQDVSTKTTCANHEQCLGNGCSGKKDGNKYGKRKGDRKGFAGRRVVDVARMQDLNLTPQQVSAIEELNKKQVEEAKTSREAAKTQKNDVKRQRNDMREQRSRAYLAQLKTILTPEQYQKMLEDRFVGNNSRGDRAMKQGTDQSGARASRSNGGQATK
ncbi:MAG: hypothetical protein K2F62_01995 [Muribaculaceae bacterium]|nr:hypothetical protein [Muribaculaceae bacterium]